jgi:hypothetical protein
MGIDINPFCWKNKQQQNFDPPEPLQWRALPGLDQLHFVCVEFISVSAMHAHPLLLKLNENTGSCMSHIHVRTRHYFLMTQSNIDRQL